MDEKTSTEVGFHSGGLGRHNEEKFQTVVNAQSKPEPEVQPSTETEAPPVSQHVIPAQLLNVQAVAESSLVMLIHPGVESQKVVKLLSQHLEFLHHQVETSEMKRARTVQALAKLEAENESLKTGKNVMQIQHESLQTHYDSLNKEIGNLNKENGSLKAEINTLKYVNSNLRNEATECTNRKSTIEGELAISTQARDMLLEENETLRNELSDGRPTPDEWAKMQRGMEHMHRKLGNFVQTLYRRDQEAAALLEQLREAEEQLKAEIDKRKEPQGWKDKIIEIESVLRGTLTML
ncbi:hypothetical protein EV426DRAFT_575852 [Tirmania nivea]|nr:hypothetical protein EV426DRAFT_575852 [Tirmania nivea]